MKCHNLVLNIRVWFFFYFFVFEIIIIPHRTSMSQEPRYQTDTNDYTVVSFPYVLPEKENGRRIYVHPSVTWLGDILTHKSHWVSELFDCHNDSSFIFDHKIYNYVLCCSACFVAMQINSLYLSSKIFKRKILNKRNDILFSIFFYFLT